MTLIKCKECGKEVSSKAETCVHCGARIASKSGMGCGTIVGIVIVLGVIAIIFNGNPTRQSSGNLPSTQARTEIRDDSKNFISIFGEPDLIHSTEYDDPRPELVTKIFIYKKQNVAVIFYPNAQTNTPPPYEGWELLGFIDPRTQQSISIDEMQRRMGKRITD